MSLRHIRKILGPTTLPPPEEEDENYEPLYAKKVTQNFNFLELESNSHSEQENASDAVESEETEITQKKKKNKKKKQRKNKALKNSVLETTKDMDEIDKSLLEVNAMLGPPKAVVITPQQEDPDILVMAISSKYLNAENEMNRRFGPDPEDKDAAKRRKREAHVRLMKRAIILPELDESRALTLTNGLSMSLDRQENGLVYFTFNHNREIQRLHQMLLVNNNGRWGESDASMLSLDGVTNAHVEGLMDTLDSLYKFEMYSLANVLLEQGLGHMQRAAHYRFNLTNRQVRLEYKVRENRPFHILVLKYMYAVTNKACHRTALELAKVLMNLDPSDPLAVMTVVDVLALRAREHQWLIDAVKIWTKDKNADCLFNIQYSNAMSHFHVIKKSKGDMAEADKLIQLAILNYPAVVMKLYESASVPIDATMRAHPLFNERDTTKNLQDLISLYSKLSWSRWKEQPVMEWLKRNVKEVMQRYNESDSVKEEAKKFKNKRLNLFQAYPKEIIRHLSIIKPMANLLVDGAVPDVGPHCPFNPAPPANSIDRYKYDVRDLSNVMDGQNVMYRLFSSVLPNQNPYANDNNPPERDERDDLDDDSEDEERQELEAHLEQLMNVNNLPPFNDNSRRNNLLNSAGNVRNALMYFLSEMFENMFVTEIERRVERRRARIERQRNILNEQIDRAARLRFEPHLHVRNARVELNQTVTNEQTESRSYRQYGRPNAQDEPTAQDEPNAQDEPTAQDEPNARDETNGPVELDEY